MICLTKFVLLNALLILIVILVNTLFDEA